MCDQKYGPPLPEPRECAADNFRTLRVEIRSRLVEDHERRIAEKRAGDRDPPPLTRGKRPPPVADNGPETVGEPADELIGSRELRGGADARLAGGGIAERDVFRHGAAGRESGTAEPRRGAPAKSPGRIPRGPPLRR